MSKRAQCNAAPIHHLADGGQPLYAIHPLDDLPEEKRSPDGLGTMRLSTMQKAMLLALRSYIAVMIVLVAIKMLTLAGWIHLGIG